MTLPGPWAQPRDRKLNRQVKFKHDVPFAAKLIIVGISVLFKHVDMTTGTETFVWDVNQREVRPVHGLGSVKAGGVASFTVTESKKSRVPRGIASQGLIAPVIKE